MPARSSFDDYKADGNAWITLSSGEYYPDILVPACELYQPIITLFGQMVKEAHSSPDLLHTISAVKSTWTRIQLARVFRKYVSPETPVEMLKKKTAISKICEDFGPGFRSIVEVHKRYVERPIPDEALCAVLWEYKDRGKKGYDLTERAFRLLRGYLPGFLLVGPERAGKDIRLGDLFPDYPKPDRPVDFVIFDGSEASYQTSVAVGLARYDSDRGGAQEDDRTGQYREVTQEVLSYATTHNLAGLKVIFINDGPGLLLGSMWDDYAYIERQGAEKVKVVTLRMIPERITPEWLRG